MNELKLLYRNVRYKVILSMRVKMTFSSAERGKCLVQDLCQDENHFIPRFYRGYPKD